MTCPSPFLSGDGSRPPTEVEFWFVVMQGILIEFCLRRDSCFGTGRHFLCALPVGCGNAISSHFLVGIETSFSPLLPRSFGIRSVCLVAASLLHIHIHSCIFMYIQVVFRVSLLCCNHPDAKCAPIEKIKRSHQRVWEKEILRSSGTYEVLYLANSWMRRRESGPYRP